MKRAKTALSLFATFAIATFITVWMPAQAQVSGSFDTKQYGFQRGYRDGFEYGRDVRARGGALDFRTDAYRQADRGYRDYFGPREAFRQGYQDGYQAGAQDGFSGATTRLEQTFVPQGGYDPDRGGEDQIVTMYRDRHWEVQDVASDIGYRDGVNAGLKDFHDHHAFRPTEHSAWKEADRGYSSALGNKDEYKRLYRTAYESGYKDGFGSQIR